MSKNDESTLKLLLASAQVGTWEYHCLTKEMIWSDQMYKIFDRSLHMESPTMEDIHGSFHHSDRFQWELLINKVSIDGGPVDINIRLIDSRNNVRWIRKTAQGFFENLILVSIKGICQDITELKRLETHFELTRGFFE
jgi:PAS domain-containing protein